MHLWKALLHSSTNLREIHRRLPINEYSTSQIISTTSVKTNGYLPRATREVYWAARVPSRATTAVNKDSCRETAPSHAIHPCQSSQCGYKTIINQLTSMPGLAILELVGSCCSTHIMLWCFHLSVSREQRFCRK